MAGPDAVPRDDQVVAVAELVEGRHRVLVVSRPLVFHGVRNASGKVVFTISTADAIRLARNPKLARFRYEGLP